MNNTANKQSLAMTFTKDKNALQMLLISSIENERWMSLRRALRLKMFVDAARSFHENEALFGANILHIILRNDPPSDMIDCILSKFPETPFLPDSVGRYPLHIASSVGMSSDILETIVMAYPKACMKQDLDGRVPLHFACDSDCALYEEDLNSTKYTPLNVDAIRCLVSFAPKSVLIEDMEEMNAIEHAILSHATSDVISLLQHASVKEHRKKHTQVKQCLKTSFINYGTADKDVNEEDLNDTLSTILVDDDIEAGDSVVNTHIRQALKTKRS